MERFSKKKLIAFKKRLQNRRRHLRTTSRFREREALEQLGLEDVGEISNKRLHAADLGSGSFQQEVDLQLVEHEDDLIQLVDRALYRIDQGDFGSCRECGEDIDLKRLLKIPESEMCWTCQVDIEREKSSVKKPNWDKGGTSFQPMIDQVLDKEFG